MKILFFYQYFGTPKGSWSTRVYELCRRWVAEGHEVTVVTAPYYKSDIKTNRFISKQNFEGIQVLIINSADSNKHSTFKRAFNALRFSLVSTYFALFLETDVVISSSGPITAAIPGLLAKWLRRKPFVFEVRDLWPKGGIELGKLKSKFIIKIALWFEKLCYKNAALVVPCSVGMEEGVKEIYPEVRTLVIPNACDTALFSNVKELPNDFPIHLKGKKIFLYTGSLGLMDDCSQAIRAMEFVKDDSIAMVFAGDGAERSHLEILASKIKNPNIYFLGLLPKIEIVKWFSIATASLVTFKDYPVLHTSSPNKMFDSFAAGVPIIQTTRGWIKELVEKENCGINALPDKPETIANAINLLASDKDLREKMGKEARRLAETSFNRDILAEKYLDFLSEIHVEK
jgi:glycosyltransferase involved in cell wall biosynthesis